MRTVRVIVERTNDDTYSAYMPDDNNLHFNAIGEGKTVKDACDDFLAVIEAFRVDFPDEVADLKFEFAYDMT